MNARFLALVVLCASSAFAEGEEAPPEQGEAAAPPAEMAARPDQTVAVPEDYEGLDPEVLKMLEAQGIHGEVVVTAPRLDLKRVAGSANAISEQELERFEYQDVHRVLEKVPGVYLRGEDGFGLRPNIGLRGANSDRSSKVTLMEDGILFAPAPYSAPAAYYFPLMNRITALEVYKGPAAVRFGPNTVGGSVNIRTREVPKDGAQGVLDAALGLETFGRAHGAVGYGTERAGILIEGIHARTDGFKQLDGGGDTGFNKNELMLKARYATPADAAVHQSLDLKLGYANEDSRETYLGLTDEDFARTPMRRYAGSQNDRMTWGRTSAQLTYGLRPSRAVELAITGYRNDFSRAWTKLNRFRRGPELSSILEYPQGQSAILAAILRGQEDSSIPDEALMVGTNDRRFVSQGLQADGVWRPEEGETLSHLVRFGARLHYDRIERIHSEDAYLMRGGALEPEGTDTLLATRNFGATTALSLFAVDELVWDRLIVTPGVRAEVVQTRFQDLLGDATGERRDVVLLPGVGALYHLGEAWSALVGVHRGYSPAAPAPADHAASAEFSVNYEAGGRYEKKGTRGELIGFFNDYSNLTGECTFSTGCPDDLLNRQFNAGRVHVYGLEAMAGHQFALPLGTQVQLTGTYTLTLSRFLTSFESANPQFGEVEPGDALPYVPTHQGSFSATVLGHRWSATVSTTYVGEMREQAGQGPIPDRERLPQHAIIDLAASFSPVEDGDIYATVENLLNTPYLASRRPFGARPGRPLFVQLGYRHRF